MNSSSNSYRWTVSVVFSLLALRHRRVRFAGILFCLLLGSLWNCLTPSFVRADLGTDFTWIGTETTNTDSIAWGDWDGDGDLDLALGNAPMWNGSQYVGGENQVYENTSGSLSLIWESTGVTLTTTSVAWGDYDGDGDLDLAAGNYGEVNQVFENDGGTLKLDPGNGFGWESTGDERDTVSVAWGDADGDGDLDIAVGNIGPNSSQCQMSQLYHNDGNGGFTTQDLGSSSRCTQSVAWGDADGDGDLDLAVGNYWNFVDQLYRNDGTGVLTAEDIETVGRHTESVAWGDVDGDGDLDLAVGNNGRDRLCCNDGSGAFTCKDLGAAGGVSYSVAWGDADGDGDLDLGVANSWINQLYRNDGGILSPAWELSGGLKNARSMAWGDVDGNGDLELAVGNWTQVNQLYHNDGSGGFAPDPQILGSDGEITYSVAWGDADGDGDLDLAVGTEGIDHLCRNDGSNGFTIEDFSASGDTNSVTWGDADGDGDLDLVVGNVGVNRLYRNGGSQGFTIEDMTGDIRRTESVAWGDADGDGDLDIAVGNSQWSVGALNQIYWNNGSGGFVAEDLGTDMKNTMSVAWGDGDGDGDLDLAVGNGNQVNQVYWNDGNGNFFPEDLGTATKSTRSVAWGDADGDGDLDLAVGNSGWVTQLYRNDGSGGFVLEDMGNDVKTTLGIAWGDADGDGDLDLAVGSYGANQIYINDGYGIFTPKEIGTIANDTWSVAWGDADGDGDLDLAVGNEGQANQIFYNARRGGQVLPDNPASLSIESPYAASANFYASPLVLDNHIIPITYTLSDPELDPVGYIVPFYSLDGGGRWLQAVATDTITTDLSSGYSTQITPSLGLSDMGTVSITLAPGTTGPLVNLAVGLTISHSQSSQLAAALHSPWPSPTGTQVVLFEGVGGDRPGFADLTLSDQASHPITEVTDIGVSATSWASTDVPKTINSGTINTIASTLVVAGGPPTIVDLDVVGLTGNHSFISDLEFSLTSPAGTLVQIMARSCGSEDDFDLNLDDEAASGDWPCPPDDGGTYQPSNPLAAFDGENSNGTWTLVITDHASLDGGSLEGWGLRLSSETPITAPVAGTYRPAQPLYRLRGAPLDMDLTLTITDSVSGETGSLEKWALKSIGATHVYTWDIFASGVFGRSDNVVFRVEATSQPGQSGITGTHRYTNKVPGPFLWPYVAAATFPFRVRGTQVRVLSGTTPISDALVYRLPAGKLTGGLPFADGTGTPFRTDEQGYLQGRGEIFPGDHLMAMLPVSATDSYTVYLTSASPTLTALDAYTVTSGGVQTLTLSSHNPLILFNLDFSMEWDAHNDAAYLEQLHFYLQRASEYLYDFTNGQVALGDVNVFQNADEWVFSHVVVRANNRLRPFAIQGGIVSTDTIDPHHNSPTDTIRYSPGQVTMGSVWNRYGNPGQSLGEDWPIILAHELSHFLLFHDDVYLGMDDSGNLISVDTCQGSAMGDLYDRPDNTEFIADEAYWQTYCYNTLAEQTLGRNEWETMQLWYQWLISPTTINPGPSIMPFDFTHVLIHDPYTPTDTLVDPTFYIDYVGGGASSSEARAYLLRDQFLINLGSPFGGQNRVIARGAQAGDRLCVFDRPSAQFGCESIEPGDDRLAMRQDADWNPIITLTPINSTTFAVNLTNPVSITFPLHARIFPDLGYAPDPITLTLTSDEYSGTFSLSFPTLSGNLQVWVDEPAAETSPRRESIVAYTIGGNPGMFRGAGGMFRGAGGMFRGAGGMFRGAGGMFRGAGAPILSADGQMIFFTENPIDFITGTLFAIQGMAGLPPLPPGRTLIGQGYNLLASPGYTLPVGSVSIQYLSNDVLVAGASESDLALYFWNGDAWSTLDTVLDTYFNLASAPSQGEGVYALMASIKIPLHGPGWNNFAYAAQGSRPITQALLSISGHYTTVYGYESTDTFDPWRVYDVTVPDWVNSLRRLEFGQGYWINVSQSITLHLGSGLSAATGDQVALLDEPDMLFPPSTFYGALLPQSGFTPTVGVTLTARVVPGDIPCGRTRTREVDGQVVYVVDVFADGGLGSPTYGCGASGRTVRFDLNGLSMFPVDTWDNRRLWHLDLSLASSTAYLPLVLK